MPHWIAEFRDNEGVATFNLRRDWHAKFLAKDLVAANQEVQTLLKSSKPPGTKLLRLYQEIGLPEPVVKVVRDEPKPRRKAA